ncbi:SafA/ExsA family spore coat assembly protein [Psychrobacillus sp. L4]|uniref:SafA/ExsA family spore coat assembly protein n=1 Tax=Psychrobacillus sp. L4 TaxID=3236892 RepID=UPI0036F32DEF
MHIHIVQKGDTLWKISRSYDVSFDELKKLNAHLANPEYIVPGMKIFIPETKKMESTRHPYSEERHVKKEMVKKEEVKIQPHPGTNMNYQPSHPHHESHHHHHLHHPHHPVHISHPVHPIYKAQPVHPIYKAMPVQPVPIAPPVQQAPPPPIQQAPPVHTYTMPYHIMPVPEIEMTPSPQGWRLIESTSIHINIHNEDREKEEINVITEANPVNQVQPPPQPIPTPPAPQNVSPMMEEPSSEMVPMYPYEPMCQCEQCQSMQSFPYMEPDMQEMQSYGHYPYMPVCYVPVYPCPPHPCPPHPFHHF